MQRKIKGLLIVISALPSHGCGGTISVEVLPATPVVTPALTHAVITEMGVAQLAEVQSLEVEDAGPVTAFALDAQIQTLYAVYADEGALRSWRLSDGSLLDTVDVYPVGLGGAAFDATGSLLATSAGAEWLNNTMNDDYLGWQVWKVPSGELVVQHHKTYESMITRSLFPDILLSPDGSWTLMIATSADLALMRMKNFLMFGIATPQTGDGLVDFSRRPEEDDFDVIAFDAQGEHIAAADEAGKVAIYRFEPPKYPREPVAVVEKPKSELGPRPLALAFDPARRWLAAVRGTELTVWDLQSRTYQRQVAATMGDRKGITASLAFDPTGTLLAVGTVNGWQIWDVANATLLMENKEYDVYAVTFSPDGRLFAWGDTEGVVHVWGIPDSP